MSTIDQSGSPTRPQPIPIRTRTRSETSEDSSLSSTPPETPAHSQSASRPSIVSPSSPILSYFMNKSPSARPGAYTWSTSFNGGTVFEDADKEPELPVTKHARRASVGGAGRFGNTHNSSPLDGMRTDNGGTIFRRLSLTRGSTIAAMPEPTPPPNTAVSPTSAGAQPWANTPQDMSSRVGRTKQRSMTMAAGEKPPPRRPVSPMGERILKGHFDGFN